MHDRSYEDMVVKFVEHFVYIANAINRPGQDGLWDEEDGFYYDLLRLPDGSARRLKVRSMVGLLPLCATSIIEAWQRERVPRAWAQLHQRAQRMPELMESIHPTGPGHFGRGRPGDSGSGQTGAASPDPHEDARRERVPEPLRHPLAFQVPRAAPVHLPGAGPGIPGRLPAGGVEHRHVRRQLQLAGTDLDAGEHAHHPGPPRASICTTATTSKLNARRAPAR